MAADFTIFVVDDDKAMRTLFEKAFSGKYHLELFESGEACLNRLDECHPDLLLLDVEMPTLTGYELCRLLKGRAETAAIPIMFISGHDDSACILAGYEAGGEDYILKPIHVGGVQRKIETLRQLKQQNLAGAGRGPAQAVENLDDAGALIGFLHAANASRSVPEIAEAVLRASEIFRLELVVQFHLADSERTWSRKGENWPLEIAAARHVRHLGREYHARQLAAFNQPALTLLVSNMPVDSAALGERIARYLDAVAETAHARLLALQPDLGQAPEGMAAVLADLRRAEAVCAAHGGDAGLQGTLQVAALLDDLLKLLAPLGIDEEMEVQLYALLQKHCREQSGIFETVRDLRGQLQQIADRLQEVASI